MQVTSFEWLNAKIEKISTKDKFEIYGIFCTILYTCICLDKARHTVPTALLVRVQRLRNDLYKVVKGPSTIPIVLSMIPGSYWRRQRCFTIFEYEMKFASPLTSLIEDKIILEDWVSDSLRFIFLKDIAPNFDRSSEYNLKNFPNVFLSLWYL